MSSKRQNKSHSTKQSSVNGASTLARQAAKHQNSKSTKPSIPDVPIAPSNAISSNFLKSFANINESVCLPIGAFALGTLSTDIGRMNLCHSELMKLIGIIQTIDTNKPSLTSLTDFVVATPTLQFTMKLSNDNSDGMSMPVGYQSCLFAIYWITVRINEAADDNDVGPTTISLVKDDFDLWASDLVSRFPQLQPYWSAFYSQSPIRLDPNICQDIVSGLELPVVMSIMDSSDRSYLLLACATPRAMSLADCRKLMQLHSFSIVIRDDGSFYPVSLAASSKALDTAVFQVISTLYNRMIRHGKLAAPLPPHQVISVAGDGNCLFHAVSGALGSDDPLYYARLRELASDYLTSNPHGQSVLYEKGFSLTDVNRDLRPDKSYNSDVCELAVFALSQALSASITVHTKGHVWPPVVFTPLNTAQQSHAIDIILSNPNGGAAAHYDYIKFDEVQQLHPSCASLDNTDQDMSIAECDDLVSSAFSISPPLLQSNTVYQPSLTVSSPAHACLDQQPSPQLSKHLLVSDIPLLADSSTQAKLVVEALLYWNIPHERAVICELLIAPRFISPCGRFGSIVIKLANPISHNFESNMATGVQPTQLICKTSPRSPSSIEASALAIAESSSLSSRLYGQFIQDISHLNDAGPIAVFRGISSHSSLSMYHAHIINDWINALLPELAPLGRVLIRYHTMHATRYRNNKQKATRMSRFESVLTAELLVHSNVDRNMIYKRLHTKLHPSQSRQEIVLAGFATTVYPNHSFVLADGGDAAAKINMIEIMHIPPSISTHSICNSILNSSVVSQDDVLSFCRIDTSCPYSTPFKQNRKTDSLLVIFSKHVPAQLGQLLFDTQTVIPVTSSRLSIMLHDCIPYRMSSRPPSTPPIITTAQATPQPSSLFPTSQAKAASVSGISGRSWTTVVRNNRPTTLASSGASNHQDSALDNATQNSLQEQLHQLKTQVEHLTLSLSQHGAVHGSSPHSTIINAHLSKSIDSSLTDPKSQMSQAIARYIQQPLIDLEHRVTTAANNMVTALHDKVTDTSQILQETRLQLADTIQHVEGIGISVKSIYEHSHSQAAAISLIQASMERGFSQTGGVLELILSKLPSSSSTNNQLVISAVPIMGNLTGQPHGRDNCVQDESADGNDTEDDNHRRQSRRTMISQSSPFVSGTSFVSDSPILDISLCEHGGNDDVSDIPTQVDPSQLYYRPNYDDENESI